MGQTIIEKIFSNHSKDEVKPGSIIWLDIDIRTARDFAGANVVKNLEKYYPDFKLPETGKTLFNFDCVVPANTIPYANNQHICRTFAKKHNIEVSDVDMGIGSHVVIEKGLAIPGSTIVGTDSHLNILGAIGAFGQGMGDRDIAFSFKAGKVWFEVPESMKVIVKGELKSPCSARDLTFAIMKKLGPAGALGKSVEFYGKAIDELSIAGRITLSSQVTEMGGIIGFIPANEKVISFAKIRSGNKNIQPTLADDDANYSEIIEIDITDLEPLVAAPPNPTNIFKASELKDIKIDSAFIGSCTNGRCEDFEVVAEIVRGKKVAEGVMAKIVPATKEVYGYLLEREMLKIFFDAGIIVSNPGCGGCASGQIGMTGKGEVQISSSNRNFKGKQGAGDTYLASPATIAHSILTGYITPAS